MAGGKGRAVSALWNGTRGWLEACHRRQAEPARALDDGVAANPKMACDAMPREAIGTQAQKVGIGLLGPVDWSRHRVVLGKAEC